jgi:hypothetical protein
MIELAEVPKVLARYLSMINQAAERPADSGNPIVELRQTEDSVDSHPAYSAAENRWGDRQATITDIVIIQRGVENPKVLIPGLVTEVRFRVAFHADIERPIYGMAIKAESGAILFSTNSRQLLIPLHTPCQMVGDVVQPVFVFTPIFRDGDYRLSLGVASDLAGRIVPHDRRYDLISLHIATPNPAESEIDMSPGFRFWKEA